MSVVINFSISGYDSSYFKEGLHPVTLKRAVQDGARILKKSGLDFQAVAFQGVSGALVAPALALKMEKFPIAIRKNLLDGTHSGRLVEGVGGNYKYIIVDDFIERGKTVRRIIETMKEHRPEAICVGVFLWRSRDDQEMIDGIPVFHYFPEWPEPEAGKSV
jgi:orotate phosphoribosyltransferase